MTSISQLKRKDIKNEVKRIQKLPKYEQKRQMNALCKKVIDDIETTGTRVKIYNRFWDKKKEAMKLLSCVKVLPEDYRKFVYITWDNAFNNKVNKTVNNVEHIFKTKTAHVSGLPLPKQAEVNIWWQGDMLMFASASTDFSLPIERIMGLGTTCLGRDHLSISYYLTIEYKKEGEIKCIVVRVTWKHTFDDLIKYFEERRGARDKIKQEL